MIKANEMMLSTEDTDGYTAYDKACDSKVWNSEVCNEDGMPYDMLDENGEMIE